MRCSHCHQPGHNKRTCPILTKRLKRRHDTDIAEGHTNTSAIQQYKDRIAPKGMKVRVSRQCGYCQRFGHTRRKCEAMERDKVTYEKHHNMVLRAVRDYISSCPIGIGSLFSQNRDVWADTGYIKKERKLVVVDFGISSDLMTISPRPWLEMIDFVTGERLFKSLRYFTSGRGDISYHNPVRLISAEASLIPDDWAEKKMVRIGVAAKHSYFKRSGDKSDDERAWAFKRIERAEKRTPDSVHYADDQRFISEWSEKSIRENIIKLHARA